MTARNTTYRSLGTDPKPERMIEPPQHLLAGDIRCGCVQPEVEARRAGDPTGRRSVGMFNVCLEIECDGERHGEEQGGLDRVSLH